MTRDDLLKLINHNAIIVERVEKLESLYACKLPENIKHFISILDADLFLESGKRVLSYSDILDAKDDLQVDFIAHNVIPLVDCCDNDYIVYCIKSNSWSMFNIVDEIFYKYKSSLEELL